jgi:hypothetical protein
LLSTQLACILLAERGAAEFLIPAICDLIKDPKKFRVCILATLPVIEFLEKNQVLIKRKAELLALTSEIWTSHAKIIGSADVCISSATSSKDELTFSLIAKTHDVPLLHIIDAFYGYGKRMVFGDVPYHRDHIVVIDELAKREAVTEGLPKARIVSVGHPGWECLATSRLDHLQKKNENKKSIFLGAPIKRDYGYTLGFSEDEAWNLLLEAQALFPSLLGRIVYCMHPKQKNLPDTGGVKIVEYRPSLLKKYDQVFGMFSAPLMHAALLNRLPISIQPGQSETDVCAFSRRGFIHRATSVSDIKNILTRHAKKDVDQFRAYLNGSTERLLSLIK